MRRSVQLNNLGVRMNFFENLIIAVLTVAYVALALCCAVVALPLWLAWMLVSQDEEDVRRSEHRYCANDVAGPCGPDCYFVRDENFDCELRRVA